jgi:hypothetical protein
MHKEYLGDAVYAAQDDYGLVLTTENGISATNTIVLEPEVLEALLAYLKRHSLPLREKKEKISREDMGFGGDWK